MSRFPAHAPKLIAAAVFPLWLVMASYAADWPTYRHDLARSGVTTDQLAPDLHLQWTHRAQHPPQPAWPEPGRELHRQAFDYAPDVVAAQGLVLFGSSADHKLYALDLESGTERWSYFTGAPIRFAPAIADGRVFVASDDGYVRCLQLSDGSAIWRFRGGPEDELMFGNGQMMSRWPIRSGVGVDAGIVYVAAGMWPSEGVYVYALNADNGAIVWEQLETATRYKAQPHPGAYALLGVAPQGYIVADDSRMFIPTGRNVPAAFNRTNGALQYYHSAPDGWGNRWGGTWNMVVRDRLLAWRNHHVPDLPAAVGEAAPHPEDGLVAFDVATGRRGLEVRGKLRAVADGSLLYASGGGRIGAYDLDAWFSGRGLNARWEGDVGRTYSLIKAGDALISGGDGTVAMHAVGSGDKLWQAQPDGQVRGLAAADGNLLVSTTSGHILCYGAANRRAPAVIQPAPAAGHLQRLAADGEAGERADRVLEASGSSEGYCLALSTPSPAFLYRIATASDLRIYVPEPDADNARRLRREMDLAGLYGSRAVVHSGDLGTLRYPTYFADLIVGGNGADHGLATLNPAEVYRLLRPSGGRLCVALEAGGLPSDDIVRWLRRGGVPEAEIRIMDDAVLVSRGTLPGSDDWSHQYGNAARTGSSADERVRLPFRMLWFGDPGPATLVSRHWQGPAPLCVDGRLFVTGQRHISAVDAYNGRKLWRREFSEAGRWSIPGKGSNVAATSDSVFLASADQCERMSATTGEALNTYRMPEIAEMPAELRASLNTWCFLAVADTHVLGSMGRSVSEGRGLFALDQDNGAVAWTYQTVGPVPNNGVSVGPNRLYLIERIGNGEAAAAADRGITVKAGKRLVALDRRTGQAHWTTQEDIGKRTTLWLSDGVLVALGGGGFTGYDANTGEVLYTRTAAFRRSAVITGGTIYVQPLAFDLRTGKSRLRNSTFTDNRSAWNFVRSYGCGSMGGSPNLLAFRSATLGFYGLDGDTGVHNFPGVRAGCCINAIPANGLLLVSPGDAGCSCSYSFQTTLALVHDSSRDNWGIFHDRLPNTTIERVSLNLGAPGDRRTGDGTLWLAVPRPPTPSHRRDIAVPFRYECREGFGPYYQTGRTAALTDTDAPWVYSSGIRGVRRLELDLDIVERGFAAWYTETTPTIDGNLEEACWDDYKAYPCQVKDGAIMVRYDRETLYLGCRRPLPTQAAAEVETVGKDGPVWDEGAFEVLISNVPVAPASRAATCLHVGLSPSGARYDAKWRFVSAYGCLDIPRVDVAVDGSSDDWGERGLRVVSLPGPGGVLRAPEDLDTSFRIGWNDDGLVILARVVDNTVRESPRADRLYEGDSLELFMTPEIGGAESFQVAISPGACREQTETRHQFFDRRRATRKRKLAADIAGAAATDGYIIEVLLPWENLGIEPSLGTEFGLQVFINDSDGPAARGPQAQWHPAGHTEKNPDAYQGFRLAADADAPIVFTRSKAPNAKGLYPAAQPHAFPLTDPPLGAEPEQPDYDGRWQSAVQRSGQSLGAEIAIPWATLEAAGLERKQLMVALRHRGPLTAAPRRSTGFEPLRLIPMAKGRPRVVDVRLHFAEPDGASPGQRVFDIRLQGKTVLEGFDPAKAATAAGGPVVREFRDVSIAKALMVEFVPRTGAAEAAEMPVISGIEFRDATK